MSGLALAEEVLVRLQRGKNRAKFERSLKALLKGEQERDKVGSPAFDTLDRWAEFYDGLGIPLLNLPTEAQKAALREFGFRPIFMPAIGEDQFPLDFVKPKWGQHLDVKQVARHALPGRLVAVESIAKPNYTDPAGYPNDKLGQTLGLKSRFGVSYDDLQGGILAKVARTLGLPESQVRLPYAEEWNFTANVFNHLRVKFSDNLPDLGATNSWEWCENPFGSDGRLIAGYRGDGGLSAVSGGWLGHRYDALGFRVLAVL